MSERKYLDAETLKQHLFAEATLGYIKTLADVNRVIDALPEADPQEMARQLWRDAKKDPPDPNVDVIVYCSDGAILTAFMYDNGDWAENRECIPLDDVTHWMPNITGPELEEKRTMGKFGSRQPRGKAAMTTNMRKIVRQNQLCGFLMALDGIAITWGALIQNLRCELGLTDEQVQKIIRVGDRYWEMVGEFKNEGMAPEEFAEYLEVKSAQVEKDLREMWT